MPRDASETKARLREEAERLFADRGVWQVTVREITEAAGQRNTSAVSYHFGSREGILREILLHHGLHLDDERGRLLAELGEAATTRDLVAALLVPFAGPLATDPGRNYLRIVAQLTQRFGSWRSVDDDELTPPLLRRILTILEERPPTIPAAVRRQRVIGVIMLMTTAMAERARALQSGRPVELDEPTFLANLADMIVGALEAPLGGPLSP